MTSALCFFAGGHISVPVRFELGLKTGLDYIKGISIQLSFSH